MTSRNWKKLWVYFVLAAAVLAVYSQVHEFDFIHFDDGVYVVQNIHIQSGFTAEALRWAFSLKPFGWDPLVFVSFMIDHRLYGLNPGGYHVTNLILHILSVFLLFSLFSRMTGEIWKSAFVSALFALHPLHVESVAWIAERKDILCGLFWMLTLRFYVHYTERKTAVRYLLVMAGFISAIMSKPMAVTLPVIMLLLDYWPLQRVDWRDGKKKILLWQLREKAPLLMVSVLSALFTVFAHHKPFTEAFPLGLRTANAFVSYVAYLERTFWPRDLAIFYPYPEYIPFLKTLGAVSVIIILTVVAIAMVRRRPYLPVGWFWFAVTLMPVIGVIQIANYAMADRYHYLPSIGIGIIMAWGIPPLIRHPGIRRYVLCPAALLCLVMLTLLSWKQCGVWENSITLFGHGLKTTRNNYHMHNIRGITYGQSGRYAEAIDDFNKAIGIKPDYYIAYNNRGLAHYNTGRLHQAIDDYSEAIRLRPDYLRAYQNRAVVYLTMGDTVRGCRDARRACELGDCGILDQAGRLGDCF